MNFSAAAVGAMSRLSDGVRATYIAGEPQAPSGPWATVTVQCAYPCRGVVDVGVEVRSVKERKRNKFVFAPTLSNSVAHQTSS